jgi:hypothetical protein
MQSKGNYDAYLAMLNDSGQAEWAYAFGGIQDDNIESITLGSEGEIYVAGYFEDSVDMDPSAGYHYLYSSSSTAFVACYDANGSILWGYGFESGSSQAVSLASGHGKIYVLGTFTDSIDADPQASVFTLHAVGVDIFMLAISATGQLQFAKVIGGPSDEAVGRIHADDKNGILLTGQFTTSCDFDPSASAHVLSAPYKDGFLAAYTEDGDFVWVTQFGIQGSYPNMGYGVTSDADGNVVVVGEADERVYIARHDSIGTRLWRIVSEFNPGGSGYGSDVVVDSKGNAIVAGDFEGTIDFDSSNAFLGFQSTSGGGGENCFLIALAPDGSAQWMGKVNGSANGQHRTYDIEFNPGQSEFAICGVLKAAADFDLGPGVFSLVADANYAYDAFVARYGIESNDSVPTPTQIESVLMTATLSPNPCGTYIDLEFIGKNMNELELIIVDMWGRQLKYVLGQPGKTRLSVIDLPSGSYFLQVTASMSRLMLPFIKG